MPREFKVMDRVRVRTCDARMDCFGVVSAFVPGDLFPVKVRPDTDQLVGVFVPATIEECTLIED